MFSNVLHDCYIDNKDKEINAEIFGGIIRSGFIGGLASISPETEVINDSVDDKKMKGGIGKKNKFPDRNDNEALSKTIRFSNINAKPSGIPGVNFKEEN